MKMFSLKTCVPVVCKLIQLLGISEKKNVLCKYYCNFTVVLISDGGSSVKIFISCDFFLPMIC